MSRLSDDEIDAMESNARRALDKRFNLAAHDVIALVTELRLLRSDRDALARAVDAQRFIAEAVAYRAVHVQNEAELARQQRDEANVLVGRLYDEARRTDK